MAGAANSRNESLVVTRLLNGETPKLREMYEYERLIGEGGYGRVYLATFRLTKQHVAIKICDKRREGDNLEREILRRISAKREINILRRLRNEKYGFVHLYASFEDLNQAYFILSYASGGDLHAKINRYSRLNHDMVRHYSAEIVLALEVLDSYGIIHRDLKPANILIEGNHLQITDFGSAKIVDRQNVTNNNLGEGSRVRRSSWVGTTQYMSPEVMNRQEATRSSDLYALGWVIKEMLYGFPKFKTDEDGDLIFPEDFPPDAKDLVQKLLVVDPEERIGAHDIIGQYDEIRNHVYFREINWNTVWQGTAPMISFVILPPERHPDLTPSENGAIDPNSLPSDSGGSGRHRTRPLKIQLKRPPLPHHGISGLFNISSEEKQCRLKIQSEDNVWHEVVHGELILKQGLVYKMTRSWLPSWFPFVKRRMLLLTTGPHLFYTNPDIVICCKEIPWSPQLRVETKTSAIFDIHTPMRIYHLKAPEYFAHEWARAIDEVRLYTYGIDPD